MSTQSRIGYVESDGTVKSVYVHWDGYPSGNGRILLDHYDTLERVIELVSLGSLSSLREKVFPEEGTEHTFDNPQEDVCVAYHRDRGEGWNSVCPRIDKSVDDFMECGVGEYGYLFKDGRWYAVNGHREKKDRKLHILDDALIEKSEKTDRW